jgi:hypothetical protein
MKKQPIFVILLLLSVLPASGRAWKPQGAGLAQDYSVIVDNRPDHELVEIFWMTWPMSPSAAQALRPLLDRYVIVAVSHGRVDMDVGGKLIFDKDESAEAADLGGTSLKEIPDNSYPPAVAGAVAILGNFMRQSMGAMGEGMKFIVFDSGNVRACEKGRLSVRYAGETYVYDTPIPGCPPP